MIVNGIAHRDYSIKGTDIQIKLFDDRFVVESPGNLPGIVRLNNMRQVHFSRNPKIAAFLHEYDFVQEFGEGVDRMYTEMEKAGLPAPEYSDNAFMLNAIIRNGINDMNIGSGDNDVGNNVGNVGNNVGNLSGNELLVYQEIRENPSLSAAKIADKLALTKRSVERITKNLKEKGFILRKGSTHGKWVILK